MNTQRSPLGQIVDAIDELLNTRCERSTWGPEVAEVEGAVGLVLVLEGYLDDLESISMLRNSCHLEYQHHLP